ncbi:MAG: cation diffusion facilitator family transporter [Alphaproteobacteria bacterium]
MNKKQKDLKKIATYLSISVAAILSFIKIIAGIMTGSLAIISSLVDNLADIFASLITLIAVKYSNRKPTENYKYGYGKAEALSALAQSAFVAGSGLFIMYEAINRFIHTKNLSSGNLGLIVMIVSLALTISLVIFQRYVYKKTNSQAILADSLHYKTDILANIAIIISLIAQKAFNISWFDPLTAFLVSIYLLYNAYIISIDAIRVLLDKELNKEITKKVKELILDESFVKGLHDLRSRNLGNGYFFEVHLELDGNLSLLKAHEYCEIIENKIKSAFNNETQVIIHQDPHGIQEDRLDNKIKKKKSN